MPQVDFDYEGLGLAEWHDVVNAFAVSEPCRPFTIRGMNSDQIMARVAHELGVTAASRYLPDFEGRTFRASNGLVKKLSQYANHAAYAGWIEAAIREPLEVWEHADPKTPDLRPRRHYFAAYLGPSGATTHLVVAAFENVLINGFSVENAATANHKRFGKLLHIGYNPIYPPLPIAKGAPFPVAPLPV